MARSLKNMMGAGLGAESASLINGVVIDGLVATGSTQIDALLLTSDVNVVGTVNTGTGVRLRATPQPGDECVVANLGANALNVYPALGGTIQGGALNAAYQLSVGAAASFVARTGSLNWAVLSSGGQGAVGPTLGTLTFSGTGFTAGTSASGTIIGATVGSTITAAGLPSGLTINGGARTWAWDGTGTASTGSFTLTETLSGAANTPNNSTISYTISPSNTINAPTYALQTASGASPASWNVTGDSTFSPGMYVHQQFAANSGFSTSLTDYYTQVQGSDWEASSDTIGNGLVVFTQPTGTYFTRARFETVPGDSTNNVVSGWSNTVTDTITASSAVLTASGTKVSPYLNITNSNHSWVHNNNVGALCAVLASIVAQNTKWHAEISIDGWNSSGVWHCGITDGTIDFSSPGFQSGGSSTFPGNTASGLTFNLGPSGTVLSYAANSTSSNITLPQAAAVNDQLIIEVDETAKTIDVYWYTAATTTVSAKLATITLTTAPSAWYFFGGGERGSGTAATSDSGTFNAGGSTWKKTPSSGYNIYG